MIIYLYVKQHTITGLKYFGKTISKDPFKYLGSGKYWVPHISKHGKSHVKTLEIWGFDNQDLCTEFALKFSREHNIVESKEWANLQEENAKGGGCFGELNGMFGKRHSLESINKIKSIMPEKLKGKSYNEIHGELKASELRSKRSLSAKFKNNSGSNNPRFDQTIYKFSNEDSSYFIGTRFDFIKKYNLPKSSISCMIKNNGSYKGWTHDCID